MSRLSARCHADLEALAHLSVPIWVFDLDRHEIWWANGAALTFWRADALEALRARDFASDSETVHLRLRQTAAEAEAGNGGRFTEDWTLYPAGSPVSVTAHCRSCRIEDERAGLLVEVADADAGTPSTHDTRLQEIVRYSGAILSMYTLAGTFVMQNAHAFGCYGRPDRPERSHLSDRIAQPGGATRLLAAAARSEAFDAELDVATARGPRVHRVRAHRGRDPVTGDAVVVLNEDDVTEIVAMRRDLHELNTDLERKVAERSESLQVSEERFSLAMRGTNDGLWDLDVAAGDIYLSPRWFEMLGHEPGGVPATVEAIMALVHPDDRSEVEAKVLHADPDAGTTIEMEVRLRHADGHWVDVLSRAFLVVVDGRVARIVGTFIDMSERKRSERALRRLREILFEGSESLPVGVAYFDQDLKLVMHNALYAAMQPECGAVLVPGTPLRDILERSEADVVRGPDEETLADHVARRLQLARIEATSWERVHANGRVILVKEIPTSGDGVVAVIEDVTEERAREKQLRQAQKMEAVGQLTGGIAHDFNNLLAVVMGNLELLKLELDPPVSVSGDVDALIQAAIDAVEQGAQLTKSMLAYARKAQLTPVVVDVNQSVAEISRWMRRAIEANIEIETVLQGGIWRTRLDPVSLQSALINLILNSRDALPAGGRLTIETANVRIDDGYLEERLETIPAGRYVMVAVSDTGTGIAPDVIDQIYTPFFTTKPVGKGSGLGLSMVEGFARQSGGTIRVYSEPGVGTSFKLYFRAIEQHERDAAAAARGPSSAGAAARPRRRVLLVEDRAQVLLALRKILEGAGFDVTTAETGDIAYSIFEASPDFDVVLTDIVMPGELQGPSLAKACRAIRADTPFVFLSGYASEATVHGNGLLPGDIRLMKPIARADLLNAVDRCLAGTARD